MKKKKKKLNPPSAWPPHAQALYWEFQRKISQKLKSAHAYLLRLDQFFHYQEQAGYSFREFPQSLLGEYFNLHGTRHVITLRIWLRFLFQRKELLMPLHTELNYPRPIYRRRAILSYEQVLQLLKLPPLDEAAGLRDRAFLELAYGTGMRHGELEALDLSDVDLHSGWVYIREAKNAYQRKVPLTHWAIHFISRYLQESRPLLVTPLSPPNALWLNALGKRFARHCMGQRLHGLYRVKKTLGFPLTLHHLRHACATHLLAGGASLRDVQELLGHRDIRSTQIYTHITPVYLRSVHERCHPRNNGSMDEPES